MRYDQNSNVERSSADKRLGPGSYARMKAALNGHVEQQRHVMFQRSADEVRNHLQKMVRNLQEMLEEKADEVFLAMRRDYRSVLGCGDLPQGELLPKAQRLMRKEVMNQINKVEKMFRRIAGLEVEDDEENSDVETVPNCKLEDQSPAGPDTMDQEAYVSPYTAQSRRGQKSASTAGTDEPETQHQATKDEPMADAPGATTTVKQEANEHATRDHTSEVLPKELNVAVSALTEGSNTVPSTGLTARSSTSPSPSTINQERNRGADSKASADEDQASETYELRAGLKHEDHTDSEDSEYDDDQASTSSEIIGEPWQSKYRDTEVSDSD